MAFTLSSYIKRGLIAAVGRMADYQIILDTVQTEKLFGC